jgi:hypothetical protein
MHVYCIHATYKSKYMHIHTDTVIYMQIHTRYIQYSYAQVINRRPSQELNYTKHFFVGNGIHANTYIYIHILAYM